MKKLRRLNPSWLLGGKGIHKEVIKCAAVLFVVFLFGGYYIEKSVKNISDKTSGSNTVANLNAQSSFKNVPSINPQQQLTYGDFIWLWINSMEKSSNSEITVNQAVQIAKEHGYIPTYADTAAFITIQQVAFILANYASNSNNIKISHYDWQITDFNEIDSSYRTAVINAYSKGWLTTENGCIHPKNTLLLQDAESILGRFNKNSQQKLPPDCDAPYFEYKGLVELIRLDPTLMIDLKYATKDNFTGVQHYSQSLALLEADTAKKLIRANKYFHPKGYSIKIWDAYRPVSVQWSLYNATPANLKSYAPAPSRYSQHSKGIAADISLVDKSGNEILMPTGFDSFEDKAHVDYNALPEEILENRNYLIVGMKQEGFVVNNLEWWHFYVPKKTDLPISNVTFDDFIAKRNDYYQKFIYDYYTKKQ